MAEKQAPIRVGFYDIEKTIGKGNFAVVKLARHRLTKTEVAIKIIDKTQLQAADLRRAYREVRVLKKLHHPHIIRLYQVMETKNMLYIVTEYAPQGEVFEHIARHGRLPEAAARRLYWQVVSAVDYCHNKSVVHRDLKAENLLLDAEGCVKLADFGFSQFYSQEATLSTWCGSPPCKRAPYAAPEVFEGRNYIGPEVDIWSLGVVLYVLVCGALPFDASSLPALRDRVLSARYRVPYFMSADCESLVRKMLVKDPSKRYTINQVKKHRWMQGDGGPPRLLPAPNHSPAANSISHNKQYLDPGIAPDFPSEPNEQVLKLMSSLGIDSSRTREAIRNGAYDHHSAIYFLLLERLRQHRPGGHRYVSSGSIGNNSSSVPGASAIRMLSNDSSRRMPARRPSSIAEQAIMKIVPGQQQQQPQVPQPQSQGTAVASFSWKNHRGTSQGSQGGPSQSQTSSVDEGVADMDGLSGWMDSSTDNSSVGGNVGVHGSSSGNSSMLPSNPNSSSAPARSRQDWKWPARGNSTGSSIQISSDLSQGSGSPRESMSSSGTTLSSWDSASLHFQTSWEAGAMGLAAASLPSCTQSNSAASNERRTSITAEPLSPLGPNLTADRLDSWAPPHAPGSPTEFRLGRRASDGLVGRIAPFPSKLEVSRAVGVAKIADNDHHHLRKDVSDSFEEGCGGEVSTLGINFPEHASLNLQCSPAKRPSLPILPDLTWSQAMHERSKEDGTTGNSAQLYRQLMSLRLQRRAGGDPLDLNSYSDANARANARKSVLRQQSYKLAQQQNVLPPLPPPGLDSCVFRSISQEESRLHAHEEEEEEDEEDSVDEAGPCSLNTLSHVGYDGNSRSSIWQTLPVTMNDCKLTDSSGELSRLSPLLRLSHFQSPSSSPIPFSWEHHALQQQQQQQQSSHPSSLHLTPQNSQVQERMDLEK